MNELVINQEQSKQLVKVILGLIMIRASVYVISIEYYLAGAVGLLCFGASFIISLLRLFKPKPLLVINDKGIIDSSSSIGVGFLAWEEIRDAYIMPINHMRYIAIVPHDTEALLNKLSPYKKLAAELNFKFHDVPILISFFTANAKIEDVYSVIRQKLGPRYNEFYEEIV